jgi:hypothetical protein
MIFLNQQLSSTSRGSLKPTNRDVLFDNRIWIIFVCDDRVSPKRLYFQIQISALIQISNNLLQFFEIQYRF